MTMPPRLTVIGDLERSDHYYLAESHRCYFWGEYTPYEHTDGLRWNYSPTNQLIANLKKKMDRQEYSDWRHKQNAIDQVAQFFARGWKWGELQAHRPALIPMPPSKARTDPMYDPRMFEVLNLLSRHAGMPLDIRDCLSFSGAIAASHESASRPSPDALYQSLHVDEEASNAVASPPGVIFLFDDMLTTGAHYIAAINKLNEVFPGVDVIGNFVARRRLPSPFAATSSAEA